MSIPQTGGERVEQQEQLVAYLESGCKAESEWRIGTEHEKFGYDLSNRTPLPYDGPCSIKAMLEGLRDGYGWQPIREVGNIIGLEKDGANISLEPGGQLELSGAPLVTLHDTCNEVNEHLQEVRTVASRIGAGFIGIGAAPEWLHEQMPVMPKGRYSLMTDYMRRVGQYGVQMMYRTCTVQVNLDFGSESDMVKKMRVAIALQPVATALFANSPFFEGKVNGYMSWRARIWQDLDPDRTGMLPFVFDDGFGFEAWVDYALDVPMYFVYRNGRYLDARGMSFRDFLAGQLPVLPGELPRISDWADHLTTIFPEARVKQFIEMRGADAGPWRRLCALPALWVGLMYNSTSLEAAWDLVKNMDAESREVLRYAAAKQGLEGRHESYSLYQLASEILKISEHGLRDRMRNAGMHGLIDESHFLDALKDTIQMRKTPAEEMLELYFGEWDQNMDRIYEELSY